MLRRSETRYARAPDGAYLAYQMIGSGDVDVVYHPGAATHAELIWDFPSIMRWPLRLASMARVVTFDLRGCGASDPLPTARGFTLDESVADVVAVMDAAGIDKAALIGEAFVGPVFLRIAAQRRERVTALALSGTAARFVRTPDYPFGIPPDALERALEALEAGWGTGTTIDLWVPSLAGSSTQRREWARYDAAAAHRGVRHCWPAPGGPSTLDAICPTSEYPRWWSTRSTTAWSRSGWDAIWLRTSPARSS
jgi:pimeloyl-ACP methyl ester carboxylesterase